MWPINFLLWSQLVLSTPMLTDGIVAFIEDDIMTWQELLQKAKPYLESASQTGPLSKAQRHKLLREVLDLEIGEKMVEREIRQQRDKLQIGEADIDRAVDEVLRTNRLTKEQLRAALYGQGMSWQTYRTNIRHQMERARLMQAKVQGKVQISEQRVLERCKERQQQNQAVQVCLSHVLVSLPPHADPNQLQHATNKILQWRAELQAGADFPTFAYKNSDDKRRPDGQLGCFAPTEMLDGFAQATQDLAPGQFSQPVRTELGLHLLRVDGRRVASGQVCENLVDLDSYRSELMQEEMQRQMDLWIHELRKKAFVEDKLASFEDYWEEHT